MFKKLIASVSAIAVVGAAGLGLTQLSEGLKLKVYRDSGGVPTVCWGHTGPDVRMGDTWTKARCEIVLLEDYTGAANGLNQCLRPAQPLTVNQSDALVDLAFNVGAGAVCRSTIPASLARADHTAVTRSILSFNKATINGRLTVLRGLDNRRKAEVRLYNTPVTGHEKVYSLDNLKKLTLVR